MTNALVQNNIQAAHAERIAYERAVDWARRSHREEGRLAERSRFA